MVQATEASANHRSLCAKHLLLLQVLYIILLVPFAFPKAIFLLWFSDSRKNTNCRRNIMALYENIKILKVDLTFGQKSRHIQLSASDRFGLSTHSYIFLCHGLCPKSLLSIFEIINQLGMVSVARRPTFARHMWCLAYSTISGNLPIWGVAYTNVKKKNPISGVLNLF